MLQNEFNTLIKNLGIPIHLNDETNARKVLLSSRGLSKMEVSFDDRVIHTNFKIKRGDTITYNDVLYLVYSDVQSKRGGYEYISLIRPMTNTFQFTYMTEGVIDHYDRLGNPIYVEGKEPKEVTVDLPCIAYQDDTPALTSGQIVTLDTRIKVIMPDNSITEQIEITDEYDIANHYYNVEDINLLQKGIRIFTMEWTARPA